jgi:hypothetical protein
MTCFEVYTDRDDFGDEDAMLDRQKTTHHTPHFISVGMWMTIDGTNYQVEDVVVEEDGMGLPTRYVLVEEKDG